MGGSSKSQTVGYRYYLGMHLAICHGPVDAITEIEVGERQAWSGNLTASGRITVNMPELFGGEKREGGISGAIDAAFGQAAQTPNDYLVSKIGSPQPAYRGVLSLILRQLYIAANNPYIKPWAVRVKRCFRDWYSAKAEINGAANPAHIVYECLTNAAWGMGYPTASIDDASFRAAADVLSNEGFGLNMIWLQQSKIEQFVKEVMDHIGGVLTTSPSTGRFVLKLVRADYTVATLPILNPDNVIDLESFQRAAWGETTNEIVLIYTKPDTFKETSTAVQDLANIQAQGAVVSQTRRYPGITSDNLAARVANRFDIHQRDHPRSVGTLDHHLRVAIRAALAQRDRHRALLVRQERAVGQVQLQRAAEAFVAVADLRRAAPDFGRLVVEIRDGARRRVAGVDGDRQQFRQPAKPLFAFAQGLFGALASRNIAGHFRSPDQSALAVSHGRDGQRDIEPVAVFGDAHRFEMVDRLAALQVPQDFRLLVDSLGRDNERNRPADGLGFAVAEQPLRPGVP